MGRSLMKNAYNLGLLPQLRQALEDLGFNAADIFEIEPDAGLGNGGLGRLAACYLDSMTTLEIPATGYSICYELGIFTPEDRGRPAGGAARQLEGPGRRLAAAQAARRPRRSTSAARCGEFWDDWPSAHRQRRATTPCWRCPATWRSPATARTMSTCCACGTPRAPTPVDMSLFSRGEYLKATEEQAMADVIAKILYPEDNHYEGKSLRLKQQYFFVSATVQSIVRKHLARCTAPCRNFHEKNVIQINDTHPALVIPELMRILIDDAGLDWDEAWDITTKSVAYTNHTVLAEALERWPQNLVQQLLPRVWQILVEIANRWQKKVEDFYHDGHKTGAAWPSSGAARCAWPTCASPAAWPSTASPPSTPTSCARTCSRRPTAWSPEKFKNVTNGIDHRRWLSRDATPAWTA